MYSECTEQTLRDSAPTAIVGTTRWTSRVFLSQTFVGYVTKFAAHKALKLIAYCKLTFDGRVVANRVVPSANQILGLRFSPSKRFPGTT